MPRVGVPEDGAERREARVAIFERNRVGEVGIGFGDINRQREVFMALAQVRAKQDDGWFPIEGGYIRKLYDFDLLVLKNERGDGYWWQSVPNGHKPQMEPKGVQGFVGLESAKHNAISLMKCEQAECIKRRNHDGAHSTQALAMDPPLAPNIVCPKCSHPWIATGAHDYGNDCPKCRPAPRGMSDIELEDRCWSCRNFWVKNGVYENGPCGKCQELARVKYLDAYLQKHGWTMGSDSQHSKLVDGDRMRAEVKQLKDGWEWSVRTYRPTDVTVTGFCRTPVSALICADECLRHNARGISPAPPHTAEGIKLDDGKCRWALAQWGALEEYVRVLEYGAFGKHLPDGRRGYGADNWRTVPELDRRYFEAAMRHLVAYGKGERVDGDSGRKTLAHVMCCVAFLLQVELEELSEDSRGKVP